MSDITLTIDGKPVRVAEGKTVLEAAEAAGIKIPTLCAHKDLSPYGACRLCLVEIEGLRGYPTSCTTPATDGMVVRTRSEEVLKLRGRVLQLMLSHHPNACLVCPHREACEKYRPGVSKAGKTTRCAFCSSRPTCDLRKAALDFDARDLHLPTFYSLQNVERDDPFMDRDHNLCILCDRCGRVCEKIHGRPVIGVVNRGRWAKVGTAFGRNYVAAGCTFCGACVDICPTGTLSDRYARWYGTPEKMLRNTCTLCSQGCALFEMVAEGRLVSGRAVAFTREARLCALGRFARPQLLNNPARLRRVALKENGEQIPVTWEEAVAAVAEKLKSYRGKSFAAVLEETETRETKFLFEKLAGEVSGGRLGIVPGGGNLDDLRPVALRDDFRAGRVKAALVSGAFLDAETAAKVEYLVVADFLPSPATEKAAAVFPAATAAEVAGTFRNAAGEVLKAVRAVAAPGDSRPAWELARDLGRALGASGFDFETAAEVAAAIKNDAAPAPLPADPRDGLKNLPPRFRGHLFADLVPALAACGLPTSPPKTTPAAAAGFPVLDRTEIAPNFHRVVLKAPTIARHAKPGQFVILMVKETSERTPFTLVDWDAEKGTITLIAEELGRSSREIAELKAGNVLAHAAGPLGLPFPVKKYGTVVLGGGCYGIGAILPLARALKKAGNKVYCVMEAAGEYLFYLEEELRGACDELLFATKDGGRGLHGGVQEVFADFLQKEKKPDLFTAIGCTFMMRMVSEAVKDGGVPVQVALNPIMVDGTGMCGACRITVGGKTKFACVDGPFFDGREVDWDELFARRNAYAVEEVEALPQEVRTGSPAAHAPHGGCGCGRG